MQQENQERAERLWLRRMLLTLPLFVGASLYAIQELLRSMPNAYALAEQVLGHNVVEVLKWQGFDVGYLLVIGGLTTAIASATKSVEKNSEQESNTFVVLGSIVLLLTINARFLIAEVATLEPNTPSLVSSTPDSGTHAGDIQDTATFAISEVMLAGYGVYAAGCQYRNRKKSKN